MNEEAYNVYETAERSSNQAIADHLQSPEIQNVLERQSQEISDLQAALALAQQRLDDHNLKAELRYNEMTGWYGELRFVREKLDELSSLQTGKAESTLPAEQSDKLQLKLLYDEYQKLQLWSQELNARLQKIQGHWLYRIFGRFIR